MQFSLPALVLNPSLVLCQGIYNCVYLRHSPSHIDKNTKDSKRMFKYVKKKKQKNQTWRAWREAKKLYELEKMMENEINGLKSSNVGKKGTQCMTIQMEGPKMKLESLKEEKEAQNSSSQTGADSLVTDVGHHWVFKKENLLANVWRQT